MSAQTAVVKKQGEWLDAGYVMNIAREACSNCSQMVKKGSNLKKCPSCGAEMMK